MTADSTSGEDRLRVVVVDHVARLSGGEIALTRLLPALARSVDVHVILGEEGPLVERLRDRGIETEEIPLAPLLRDVRRETVRPTRLDLPAVAHLPVAVLRLSRRFRALDPDLVHTNSLKAAFYGGIAARAAGGPPPLHVRGRVAGGYLPPAAGVLVRAASRLLPAAVVKTPLAPLETLPAVRRA